MRSGASFFLAVTFHLCVTTVLWGSPSSGGMPPQWWLSLRQVLPKVLYQTDESKKLLQDIDVCVSAQRVLAGAVEMYGLDTKCIPISHLHAGSAPAQWGARCKAKDHPKPAGPALYPMTRDLRNRLEGAGHKLWICPNAKDKDSLGLCLTTWSNGVTCLLHGEIAPKGGRGTAPRQQLIDAGITDPEVLKLAREDGVLGADFWKIEVTTLLVQVVLPALVLFLAIGVVVRRRRRSASA